MIRAFAWVSALTGAAFCAPVLEEHVEHAGARFRVLRVAPERVQVVWKGADGKPYRSFDRVQSAFSKQGKTVRFLMNAGIFEPGGIPSGLHVEQSREFRKLNLADAPGIFFLKPNGVFWIETAGPKCDGFVATSETFGKRDAALKRNHPHRVEHAVQSGPLLLDKGRRHPAFKEGSANKLHRNGIGIDSKGRVVFAITDRGQDVNLWDFAGLFLKLGCNNALFLDGDISQMAVTPDKPVRSNQFGAMFVITE